MTGGSPTLRRWRLGAELRRLREAAGVAPADAAKALDVTDSTIYRVERGQTGIKARDVRELLALYGVKDQSTVDSLCQLAKEGKQRGWWARYRNSLTSQYADLLGVEAEANELRTFDAMVLPGLLQTEKYARALFESAAEPAPPSAVEQKVAVRMERQRRLVADNPPQLWPVIYEAAVHQLIGGPEILREQLKHLIEMSERPNVRLQVLPFRAGVNPGAVTAFVLPHVTDFPSKIAYVESLTGDLWEEGVDAERYYTMYDHLRAASLPPTDSVRLIESVARELV